MVGARDVEHAVAAHRAHEGGVRFDIETWLAHYGTAPTARPGLSAQLQWQHAVLRACAGGCDRDSCDRKRLPGSVADEPAYQLK
jgi:hypothetical protein